jgi:hypothetical protein
MNGSDSRNPSARLESIRQDFQNAFDDAHCLRLLAREIASLTDSRAGATGLLHLKDCVEYPGNFLANGAQRFVPPTSIHGLTDSLHYSDLAAWKFKNPSTFANKSSKHGFSTDELTSDQGLSLLFDPLVDAFIELNRESTWADSLVVVLTDFYPFSLCYSEIESGQDWAAKETSAYINRPEYGGTTGPLFHALTGDDPVESLEKLRDRGIFLWNLFPFFRGGVGHSGASGLPTNIKWLDLGFSWLARFLECVKAHTVILACSGDVFPHLRPSGNKVSREVQLSNPSSLPWVWADRNLPWKTIEQLPCKKLYRIHHPASWNRERKGIHKLQREMFKDLLDEWKPRLRSDFGSEDTEFDE